MQLWLNIFCYLLIAFLMTKSSHYRTRCTCLGKYMNDLEVGFQEVETAKLENCVYQFGIMDS